MRLLEILIVAAVYFTTAKIGQTLAIPPGNVTPVWVPSGIILAVVLIRGYYIWPGIFLGAFLGNVWAYIDPTSLSNILSCFFTGTANGIGDVLSAVGAAYLIKKTTGTKNPFGNSSNIMRFIVFGAVAGPAVSAIFGVTTLCIAGFLPWDAFPFTLLTWWTGDGVGALVIAPVMITWVAQGKKAFLANRKSELVAFLLILLATGAFCLNFLPLPSSVNLPLFSLAPILIWSAFRLGQRITFSGVLLISAMTILSTTIGSGPFSGKELNVSLLELQWFVAVMSITIFILSGLITERIKASEKLQMAHNNLEARVKERTADLVGANRDLNREIDERKQAENALQKSEQRMRTMFEEAPLGIALIDSLTGHIYEVNPRFAEVVDRSREEMSTIDWMSITHPDDVQEDLDNMALLNAGKITGFNMGKRYIRPDGSHVWTNMTIAPVTVADKTHPRHLCMIEDITDQKRAEEEKTKLESQLQQSQKMEAIGTLAGGIAHDFNNILAVILGNVELAADDVPRENPASKSLKEIRRASLRAKDMVQQLLAFSRKSEDETKPLNMTPVVKESLKMLRSAVPTSVEFKQHLSDDPCNIMGDAAQLNQILMNLVTNAAHAMSEDGGLLDVTLEKIILSEEKPCFDWILSPGPHIRLKVRDTGEGIAPKIMARIFDPYYTTKEVGKGTGMGLSVIHGIVKRHGGGIQVESELGEGTVFEIYFPALEKTIEKEKESDGEIKGGSERILFVDDEESMVNLNHERLERLGYQVKSTTKPLEALEWFKADPDQFDAIITDMTMPRMTGDKLTAEILKIRPHMPVIICTGYSQRMSAKKAAALGVRKYIEKPMDTRNLAAALRAVFEEN